MATIVGVAQGGGCLSLQGEKDDDADLARGGATRLAKRIPWGKFPWGVGATQTTLARSWGTVSLMMMHPFPESFLIGEGPEYETVFGGRRRWVG